MMFPELGQKAGRLATWEYYRDARSWNLTTMLRGSLCEPVESSCVVVLADNLHRQPSQQPAQIARFRNEGNLL